MRQLAAFERAKPQLEAMGCTILVASADTEAQTRNVIESQSLTYPLAFGCTREHADCIGAWWGNHPPDGEHIQPAEFLLGRGGTVLGSMYASGPLGRISVDDVINSIHGRERARLRREQAEREASGKQSQVI